MDVQIYEGEYGYTCVGRVDNDGVIYRGEYGYDRVGHLDAGGTLYGGSQAYNESPIGSVEGDKVYSGYTCVGRIENDGKVYRGEYGYDCIGRVDNSGRLLHFRAGGAALLLGLL